MKVRAKFKVDSVSLTMGSVKNHVTGQYESKPITAVSLTPVYAGSPENERFYGATPCGEIKLGIIRPEAAEMFQVGKEIFIDFHPAG